MCPFDFRGVNGGTGDGLERCKRCCSRVVLALLGDLVCSVLLVGGRLWCCQGKRGARVTRRSKGGD